MPTPDGRLNEVDDVLFDQGAADEPVPPRQPDWFDLPDLREPPGHPVAVAAPAKSEPAVLPLIVDATDAPFDTEEPVDEGGAAFGDERGRRRVLVTAAALALVAMVGTTLGVMAFTGSDASQPAVKTDREVTTTTAPTTTSPPTTTPETAPPSSDPPPPSSAPTRRAPTTTRSVSSPAPAETQAAPPPPPPPPPDPPPDPPPTTEPPTTGPPTTT